LDEASNAAQSLAACLSLKTSSDADGVEKIAQHTDMLVEPLQAA
jgi:hypothetical protein